MLVVSNTVETYRCDDAEMIRLSPFAVALPSRFRGTVDDPEVPYVVELTVAFDGDRVTCEELTCRRRCNGIPITSEGMTRIRAAELLYAVASETVREQSSFIVTGQGTAQVSHELELPAPPEGRSGPMVEHLRTVGIIYTIAHACGGSPRRAVMEALSLTRTTANRWIRLAREQGQLSAGDPAREG